MELTATDQRDKLMEAASSLQAQLKQTHESTMKVIAALVGEGDKLMLKAADEKPTSKVKKVTYVKPVLKVVKGTKPKIDTTSTDKKQIDDNLRANGLGPGKRACSVCRKPGHRAGNPICEGPPK